ncbi:cell division protein ZapA [Nitrosovibrio sp. Nv4]|uniref:cell division protein ZapA n=1 Tax=Nitrosovibrio sp. Nv4 TaxID=1945880 RepID=UPI000BC8F234|nr:cell division protein ZapA [Nitrosovibrio sp. Nv4]SOD40819.1 cell division protein ZapA [Nitrosovibrio sp. Nv4]
MKTPQTIDVVIMGREFRVACPDEEREELLQAVAYLDKKMRDIRDSGKVAGSERVAVMAALNITHELLTARNREGFDMEEFKRRIDHMQAALDAVMPEQDKLF